MFLRMGVAAVTALLWSMTLAANARADTVVYSCDGGTDFNAVFNIAADTVTLEFTNGFKLVLNQAVSGSGTRYAGGGYEFSGKGGEASVIRPGQATLRCREIGRIPAQPAPAAARPSFDCNTRLNATESRICSNATLADLDRKMAETYHWLRGQLSGARQSELGRDQRNWLSQRNACGSNDDCIEGQILERTGYLNEYLEPGSPPSNQAGGAAFPFAARSWGGIVRAGPGQNFRKIASLPEGEPITVLQQMPEIFQDRPWFKIQFGGRTGYHWGGIICPVGQAVEGTYQVCN